MTDIENQTKEIAQYKQELEVRARAVQSEKLEKERIWTNLSSENERISREIARLNVDNLDKESSIEALNQDIKDQIKAKEDATVQLEKLRKKSRNLFLCC